MELQAALSRCESLIKINSASFYQAFKMLPSPRKEAVFVIYAFCRLIDDSVDEPHQSPFTLEELETGFLQLDRADGHFIWPALRWLFDTYPIDAGPFRRQMEGQRRDLVLTQYESMDQLEEYCSLVAGTVGEMLLPVLHEQPDRDVVESGIYLGKAMQIVNIVRDVGEDMRRERRYLPLELMDRFGYSLQDYEACRINEAFVAMLRYLEGVADEWFSIGLRNLGSYPVDSAFAVEAASAYYRAILSEVAAMGFDVYNRRAVVGSAAKLRLQNHLLASYQAKLEQLGRDDSGAVS